MKKGTLVRIIPNEQTNPAYHDKIVELDVLLHGVLAGVKFIGTETKIWVPAKFLEEYKEVELV